MRCAAPHAAPSYRASHKTGSVRTCRFSTPDHCATHGWSGWPTGQTPLPGCLRHAEAMGAGCRRPLSRIPLRQTLCPSMAHKPYSALARRVRRCQTVQSSNHEGFMSKGMDQKKNQK